ncbi:PREDICTED: zinc metalloproteinase nas-13-like [Rhagoletis zephyria]|uniref:zinc metalloproteinase nas-13-like n=1 Tax=Rhagoletis zephyria TaxID=28612 RepID=UPI0008113FD8|nr:PREDICTED: zinc metalloproteinase nas-13-like [Rhagoletis zephyria]
MCRRRAFILVSMLILLNFVHTKETAPGVENFENYFNEIDVEDEQAEDKTRNAVNSPLQRWPSKLLRYKISSDYSKDEVDNVHAALRVFNDTTCLKFNEYDEIRDGNIRYINYKKSPDMCGTRVGFNPLTPTGPHDVVLNSYCLSERGVIQHETLHVLGLYHEQSRPDRNKYVQIEYANIPQKYWPQFIAYPEIYTTTYNVKYDYESLMHYSQFAFAKDQAKPSMRARIGNTVIDRKMGQILGPSEGDLTKIKIMYKC